MIKSAKFNSGKTELTIVMAVTDGLPQSPSGKTLQVATTGGNQPSGAVVSLKAIDHAVIIGLNAYVKNPDHVK